MKNIERTITNNQSETILFQLKTDDEKELEIFEDGLIPWISIKDPQKEMNQLIGKDDVVIKDNTAVLVIDYPLNKPIEIEIKSNESVGFKRGELIQLVSKEYKRIYREEEKSAKTKTVPLEDRQGLINRNETDGKYGIWGHDIEDLDLAVITIHKSNDGKTILRLIVES